MKDYGDITYNHAVRNISSYFERFRNMGSVIIKDLVSQNGQQWWEDVGFGHVSKIILLYNSISM